MVLASTSGPAPAFDPIAYLNDPAWASSNYGLERMRELMTRLGNPQNKLRYVHVAGTNGKGSTCAYLASVLQAAGLTVGLYTSPYIEVFEERIRVNGENIPADDLLKLTKRVRDAAEAMEHAAVFAGAARPRDAHPTAFELMTAVGFLYFAQCKCDVVVLEVGLGGRLDATNVIPAPEVAVIARLGLDHTEILGDTLAVIAAEKGGIIKEGSTVVSWPQEPEARAVLDGLAQGLGTAVLYPDFAKLQVEPLVLDPCAAQAPLRTFTFGEHAYRTRLLAAYQPRNAAVALTAIDALRARGWNIPQEAVEAGMEACVWPGRFEVIGTQPLRIVDGGHNPQGAIALADTLDDVLPEVYPIFVLGILADKDHGAMVQTLAPYGSAFYCVTPPTPRGLAAADLAAELRAAVGEDVPVEACESFEAAAARAFAQAKVAADDAIAGAPVIVATGSLYSVASEKAALR